MSKNYTITLHITAMDDVNLADYMASRCRSHISLRSCCPIGEMNCPFFGDKSCDNIWGKDWKKVLVPSTMENSNA